MTETCWAAELSDLADRNCRPSTGSQVAGAIQGCGQIGVGGGEFGRRPVERATSVEDAVSAVGSVVSRTVSSSARPC